MTFDFRSPSPALKWSFSSVTYASAFPHRSSVLEDSSHADHRLRRAATHKPGRPSKPSQGAPTAHRPQYKKRAKHHQEREATFQICPNPLHNRARLTPFRVSLELPPAAAHNGGRQRRRRQGARPPHGARCARCAISLTFSLFQLGPLLGRAPPLCFRDCCGALT